MSFRSLVFYLVLGVFLVFTVSAAEFSYGDIILRLDEKTGRFSLYLPPEKEGEKPRPLFFDQDPRTSFLSVMVNDRSYKMGESSSFRIHTDDETMDPGFIFESSFLTVKEEFSFIKGNNSSSVNGVMLIITLENLSDREISAGARFLLDTCLGEKVSGSSLLTDLRPINAETVLSKSDGDSYWIDDNGTYSLSGSINTGSSLDPDSVHIANWKRLNDTTWKTAYQQGRSFNYPPYSTGDSAVCYYFDPCPLGSGQTRSFGFSLLVGNSDLTVTDGPDMKERDLAELRELISIIDSRINSGIAAEEDLAAIEFTLNRLRAKYGAGRY